MNRQFETWLRSGETNLLSLRLERESYIFLRLPKRPGFDYLFAQRQYRGDGALHAEGIEYAGIYNAADGLVYDADYALIHAEGLDDTLAERSKGNLLKRLKQDVRALVERRVAGDRGNLTICELTDARSLERLEQYRKYRAPSAARELILGSLTPEDAGFSCHYRPDQWTEDMVPQRKYMATMHSVVPQRRFMGAGGSVLLQRRDVGSRLTATNDKLPLPDTGGGSLIPTQGGFFHEGLFH